MNTIIDRKNRKFRAAKRLEEAKAWVDRQEAEVLEGLKEEKIEHGYWENVAATKIQAVARGFLGRLLVEELILLRDAAILVQKRWRGIKGRMIASEERWKRVAVAPSLYAVKLMLFRSKVIKRAGNWTEYWDPDTNSFWYFNKVENNHSTWDPPECFKDKLTCVWDPWPFPYSSPFDKPCRRRFKTMAEYQAHRAFGHMWACLSCQHRNSGLNFPKCSLCGNKADEDGNNLEAKVRKMVTGALTQMRWADKKAEQEREERLSQLSLPSVSDLGLDEDSKLPRPSSGKQGEVALPHLNRTRATQKGVSFADSIVSDILESDPGAAKQTSKNDLNVKEMFSANPPDNDPRGQTLGTAISWDNTDSLLSDGDSISNISFMSEVGSNSKLGGRDHPGENHLVLKVCDRYVNGHCTKSNCPLAHPGVRDSAEEFDASQSSRRRKVVVHICREYMENSGKCSKAMLCDHYHPYIRPSTEEIIKKLYPTNTGKKIKVFISGAKMDGEMVNDKFQGYGVFTWPDGSTYMGTWKDNLRHGYGIYRTPDGREFLGTYEHGVRQGPGVLYQPNGEVYYGDFLDGRLTGVGRLESANNDVYEGQFYNGMMHGVGVFKKGNGDKFMGQIKKGKAEGLGIVAYANGIKYKGDFKEDYRHGRGACAYPSGAKYAGMWELNYHCGYGIFISAEGERYVGQWKNSMKNGYGRYYFKNGDQYDGDFVNNKACGQGLYFHREKGNYYVGHWDNDKKNGYGTYTFKNGSRYQGNWSDNNIHGKGKFWYATGNTYFGEFTKNHKNGKGTYTWANGNVYTGSFVFDKIKGHGEMKYNVTGHRFVGDWDDNKKNGFGTFYYSDGNIYIGEFKDDEIHGKGKLRIHPDTIIEESYEGEWINGVKHGYGIYKYKELEGKVYEGYWANGLRHGKGIMKFKDGSYYKGDFDKEKWHGRGIFVWADGSQYDGQWVNNVRTGEGTYLAVDGSIYQGKFYENMRHGRGVITYLDGNSYEGVWELDEIVGKGTFILRPTEDDDDRVYLSVFGY
mmetsp:Transcript_33910/g.44731  ORF Transcript_33910/g.44731 Transcript_33910/m.44731 type:complete len:1022 (+) Transcript_33910:225-3290(+)|eukprot:CAMPEP_0117865840 /NCGR_PEP_ID=MMETSP0950-20121206/6979_1 /TAXON_ID=44440 /ORGANISM="Chattonella subsalsa, Strain CCMP2191" /LENGTH=1021 /DNA_ID=CAMNT_0005717003 /DNA_START=89 /DNA_END=3154 /DNA_ORIENTATION=-